ncbi:MULTISPECIES: hypothetical protein [unclassified Bosea (in: a-proteobacteria)]|uniref:DUF6931 family protein n=1 Tax=unclassified Bosea (in: a-proteobacteria) TaxID=2653178 RepID=UPI000F75DCC7|nr:MULTISPECIES: hypothetical protein [unclassified Bosea (in: a-proteobacteria)]AZO77371.1 hypothetical protein BLM15_06940 [Bosea sp. Tri-49]RXT22231.1 hypothetical protein B5U98_17595 [Bosea sp. Tri-39]RXT32573.1 hypothetical protein B5U99_28440 [Bosea sp. Tri-54]
MSKLRFSTAQQVFEAFPTARQVIGTAPTSEPPLTFLRALVKTGEHKDAIGFCAFLMPRRETVWWALQSIQRMMPPGTPADPGLKLAEAWVRDPTDETRRAALALGESGHHASLGTWVALAAGYSGGSMVATHTIPSPPDLTAKTARIAVLTALGRVPERERDTALRNCVEACIRLLDDESGRTRP